MSHRHDEDHGRTRHRSGHYGVKRVIKGLAERFNVSRGMVIGGFVVGFVLVPILTAIAFAAAWFWVDNPERFESRLNSAADRARKAYDWTFGSKVPKENASAEEMMAEPVADFPDLRRAFERLETRTGNIEAYVSSDEYRLHREFRDMGDAR